MADEKYADVLDVQRRRLMMQLPGWKVWFIRNYIGRWHSWSATPEDAQIAMVVVNDPRDLLSECREIEVHIEDRILEAQDALDRERAGATPERLAVLQAAVNGLLALRVVLTARKAGIGCPASGAE